MFISTSVTASTDGVCDVRTVTVASAKAQAMRAGSKYRLISSTNCWVKFGADPTAVAATDGNIYMQANVPLYVVATSPDLVCAVIRDTADGNLSQTLML